MQIFKWEDKVQHKTPATCTGVSGTHGSWGIFRRLRENRITRCGFLSNSTIKGTDMGKYLASVVSTPHQKNNPFDCGVFPTQSGWHPSQDPTNGISSCRALMRFCCNILQHASTEFHLQSSCIDELWIKWSCSDISWYLSSRHGRGSPSALAQRVEGHRRLPHLTLPDALTGGCRATGGLHESPRQPHDSGLLSWSQLSC